MKSQRTVAIIGFLFILLFFLIAGVIFLGLSTAIDQTTTITIQSLIPNIFDTPLSLFSLLGSFEVTTGMLLLILFFQKKSRKIYIFGLYLLGLGLEVVGKTFINHPGPPAAFFRYNLGFLFPSSLYQTGNSFPSGHALRTTFLVVLLGCIIHQNKKISVTKKKLIISGLCFFWIIMLISRISLGEHWVSDVLAGTSLGAGFGFIAVTQLFYSSPIHRRKN